MKKMEIITAISIIASVVCLIASFKSKSPVDSKMYISFAIVSMATTFKQFNHQNK